MALYDPTLVDKELKTYFLDELKKYDSGSVLDSVIPRVAIAVATKRSSEEAELYPSCFDDIFNVRHDNRVQRSLFFHLLGEKAELDSVYSRLPNGSAKEVDEATNRFVTELLKLTYPRRVNTWLRTSEEWLQICNADWFGQVDPQKSLEEVSARDIIEYMKFDIAYG